MSKGNNHGGDRKSSAYVPLGETIEQLKNAVWVMTQTPHIRAYLAEHDPKALEQAEAALRGAAHDQATRPKTRQNV